MAIPAAAAGLTALALGRVRARNPEAVVALAGGGGVSAPGEIRTLALRIKSRRSDQLSYGGAAELRTRKRK